jgi:hypothetical protein
MPHVTVFKCDTCPSKSAHSFDKESPEVLKKQLAAQQDFHNRQQGCKGKLSVESAKDVEGADEVDEEPKAVAKPKADA